MNNLLTFRKFLVGMYVLFYHSLNKTYGVDTSVIQVCGKILSSIIHV